MDRTGRHPRGSLSGIRLARIGSLLGRTWQAVRERYGAIDGTFEPIVFDAPDPGVKLMADYRRLLAERDRRREFEKWATSGDVVAW